MFNFSQQKSDQTLKCDIWKIYVYTAVYSDISPASMYGDIEAIYSKTYYYGFKTNGLREAI